MKQIVEVQIQIGSSNSIFRIGESNPHYGTLTWIGTDKTDVGKSVVLIYEQPDKLNKENVNYRRIEYAAMPYVLIYGDDIQPKIPS